MKDLENIKEIPNHEIKNLIYCIRGKQVMLDSDVAMLYHYETKNINKAMKRNIEANNNYIDDSILKMLSKKNNNVEVIILTSYKSNIQNLDIQKFNRDFGLNKIKDDEIIKSIIKICSH